MDIQSYTAIVSQPIVVDPALHLNRTALNPTPHPKTAVDNLSTVAVIENMLQEIAYLQSTAHSDIQGYVFGVRATLEHCLAASNNKKPATTKNK